MRRYANKRVDPAMLHLPDAIDADDRANANYALRRFTAEVLPCCPRSVSNSTRCPSPR